MRIGCLFGTFDPPHNGHVAIARHMLHTQGLDQVWLVVTPQNPFKQGRQLSPEQERLAMVRLAVEGQQGLLASDLELRLPKPSYTVDSLRAMREQWPDHRFELIMGSDNLAAFHTWKNAEEILEHHGILVYPRAGAQAPVSGAVLSAHPGIRLVADAPMLAYSSTGIREDLRNGRSVQDRLAPAVLDHILERGLYRP